MEVFYATLSPMLVIFMCLIIGFILNKSKLLPDTTSLVLSRLENYIFVPALVFSTFSQHFKINAFTQHKNLFIYSIIALGIALLISIPLSKAFVKNNEYKRNIYKYAMTFGNFGFMGNAIVPAILGGDQSLYEYLLFTIALNTAVYTWGLTILTPKEYRSKNPVKNLLNPIFVSLIAGIIVGITGLNEILPSFIVTTIDYFKACMGPLAMLLTGFVVADYPFGDLISNKKVYIASLLRLLIIPAIIITLCKLLGADDNTLVMVLFAFATPLGMNTIVFPAAFGGETKTGASMAMISHSLCIISIPVMYALMTWVLSLV